MLRRRSHQGPDILSLNQPSSDTQLDQLNLIIGIMADPDDSEPEEEPLARTTSIGLSLKVPAKREQSEESARAVARASMTLTLLLEFQGSEWSAEVEVEKTIEYVKALASEKFDALNGCKNLDLKLDGSSLMDPMSLVELNTSHGNSTPPNTA